MISNMFLSQSSRAKRRCNIRLTCFFVPEGLGAICALGAVGDSTNRAKENVRLKQLLYLKFFASSIIIYTWIPYNYIIVLMKHVALFFSTIITIHFLTIITLDSSQYNYVLIVIILLICIFFNYFLFTNKFSKTRAV